MENYGYQELPERTCEASRGPIRCTDSEPLHEAWESGDPQHLVSQCFSYPRQGLVGGWPTPLKNDGLRQLGWWNSHGKIIQMYKNVPVTTNQRVIDGYWLDHWLVEEGQQGHHRGDRQRWEGWGMINDCPKCAKQRCHPHPCSPDVVEFNPTLLQNQGKKTNPIQNPSKTLLVLSFTSNPPQPLALKLASQGPSVPRWRRQTPHSRRHRPSARRSRRRGSWVEPGSSTSRWVGWNLDQTLVN